MLQQAIEKAAKSLMFAAGENEDTLRRKYGHNSLIAVLEFVRQRFSNQTYRQMFDVLSEPHSLGARDAEEALRATDSLMRKAKSKDLLDLAVLSPDTMGEMVVVFTPNLGPAGVLVLWDDYSRSMSSRLPLSTSEGAKLPRTL